MPGITKPPVQSPPSTIVATKATRSKDANSVSGTHAFLRDKDGHRNNFKSPSSAEGDGEVTEEESIEPFEPQVDFKPVVQLTQLVKPPTETDTDHILFETRAKVYRAQTDPTSHTVTEWKERGTGTFRLLMCRTTGKVRVVMRREGTHKVCINHYLSPDIPWRFAFNSTTAVTWHTPAEASDSDKQPEHAILALRMKKEEMVKELLNKVDECREWNGKLASGKEKIGSPRAPKPIRRDEDGGETTVSKSSGQGLSHQTPVPVDGTAMGARDEHKHLEEEDHVEDYEPKAHFEPVVRLDHTVNVTTGEEGEDVAFSECAVLFRYDPVKQEWKERGTGTLRILVDPPTNRARIVMRRDKVHKVCANHLITREMKLEPFTASQKSIGRTFMWMTLADVSESDSGSSCPKKETLAARFATSQLADRFKNAFSNAQSAHNGNANSEFNISETSSKSTTPTAQRKTLSHGSSVVTPGARPRNQVEAHAKTQVQTDSPCAVSPGNQKTNAATKGQRAGRPVSPAQVSTATSPTATTISLPASRDPSPVSQSRLARPAVEPRYEPRQETLVFSDRAYCYKYSPSKSKWVVLGRGDLEILQSAAASPLTAYTNLIRVRLLLDPPAVSVPMTNPLVAASRRVAFNHYIIADMKMSEHGPAAWTWFTPADGEIAAPAIVAVRFASTQDGKEFKAKWEECQTWVKAVSNGKHQLATPAVKIGPCKAATKAQSREPSPTRSGVLDERALAKLADDLGSLPPLEGNLFSGAFQPNEHLVKHIANPKSTLRTLLSTLQSKCANLPQTDLISNLKFASQCCPWIGGIEYLIHQLSTTANDTKTALTSASAHITVTLDASINAISQHIVNKIRHKDTILLLTDSDTESKDAINQALLTAAKSRKNLHVIHLATGASNWDQTLGKQLVKLGVKCTTSLNPADLSSVGKSIRLVLVPARRVLHDGSIVVANASAQENEKVASVLKFVSMEAGGDDKKHGAHVLAVCPAVYVSPDEVKFVSVKAQATEEQAGWTVSSRLLTAVVTEQGMVVPQVVDTVFERAVVKAEEERN